MSLIPAIILSFSFRDVNFIVCMDLLIAHNKFFFNGDWVNVLKHENHHITICQTLKKRLDESFYHSASIFNDLLVKLQLLMNMTVTVLDQVVIAAIKLH